MDYPKLYRKRLIPLECIGLNDTVHYYADDIIVTSWTTIRPKVDLHHGQSCYYRNEGWKISRFYREDDSLLYTYCDIVSFREDPVENALIVKDLLADVIISPDGFVKVVDLDELVEAAKKQLITEDELNGCLITLNSLLRKIYDGELEQLTEPLNKYIG